MKASEWQQCLCEQSAASWFQTVTFDLNFLTRVTLTHPLPLLSSLRLLTEDGLLWLINASALRFSSH